MRQVRNRTVQDESGSILVFFAVLLTLFLFVGAIAIDIGYWWANAKKAQIAADACALAAAQSIPEIDPTSPPPGVTDLLQGECVITAGGPDYVLANIPPQDGVSEPLRTGTKVVYPYKTDPSLVEATVYMKVGTFFGRVIGLGGIKIERRAVAERLEGEGEYAIYSHSPKCPEDPDPNLKGESLRFNGANHSIDGRVHSNGQFLINNGGAEPFWARVGTNVFCGEKIDPEDSARFFGPSYAESEETEPRPVDEYNPDGILDYENWPEWWTPDELGWLSGCTVSGSLIEIDDSVIKVNGSQYGPPHGGVIPTGTYCSTGLFKIGGNNLRGNITVLANEINVGNGNNNHFAPVTGSPGDLIFFVVPNTNLVTTDDGGPDGRGTLVCSTDATEKKLELFNGNNSTWKGKVFNPCGLIQVDGNSSSTMEGAIYGYQVHINGNGFNMVGRGGNLLTKDTALVE
jgi:hypothetical protein